MSFFFQAEDGIRGAHLGLEFRRVLFRSIGLLDEADLGRAEREAEAVIVAVLDDAMIAERPEAVAELLDAVDDEGAPRGDVQRAGERLADADRQIGSANV